MTVTDAAGLRDTKSVTVLPEKVALSFSTAPSGLTLYLDGIAKTTPFVYDTLVGFSHTVEARDQNTTDTAYTFTSWSDGAAQLRTIIVPSADQSYAATFTGVPLNAGPVARWGFQEGTGTTTTDASGNGNTLTLVNGAAWAAGKNGSGIGLDGINDYLNAPDSASLNISGSAMALSMWIKPGSVTGDSVVLGKFRTATMSSPYYQYGLELSGGRPSFQIGTSTGVRGASMDTALPLNVWTHLAVVFDGAQVRFYVGGAPAGTKPLAASITARTGLLRMGADADPWQFFKGTLDDVRIYGRTLTEAEVQSDMNTSVSVQP